MQALAVVKLRQGADETAVREILKEKMETELEDRGRPKFLHFVEEMPLAGMGKIDYNKLAADFNAFKKANIAV